jgi:hypothetical protein
MNAQRGTRLPPSILARKILCTGYVSAPIEDEERFRFQALHAMAIVRVIARHLKMGYRLRSVERGGRGYRIDLLFEGSSGRVRIVEAKSSKQIREVHKIQAALYPHADADEIAVSNREVDEVLDPEFIQEIRQRAELTRALLIDDPARAETTFTPHQDCCYTCANSGCPFLPKVRALTPASFPQTR